MTHSHLIHHWRMHYWLTHSWLMWITHSRRFATHSNCSTQDVDTLSWLIHLWLIHLWFTHSWLACIAHSWRIQITGRRMWIPFCDWFIRDSFIYDSPSRDSLVSLIRDVLYRSFVTYSLIRDVFTWLDAGYGNSPTEPQPSSSCRCIHSWLTPL